LRRVPQSPKPLARACWDTPPDLGADGLRGLAEDADGIEDRPDGRASPAKADRPMPTRTPGSIRSASGLRASVFFRTTTVCRAMRRGRRIFMRSGVIVQI
jgi:hypothetical protein